MDGARFCHKCGRPVDGIDPMDKLLTEDAPDVVVTPPATVPPPLPVAPMSIGFRNPLSVRAGLMAVAITFLPTYLAGQLVSPVMLFGGLIVTGLLGVLLYLRSSGRGVTTIEGARQGWISGLFFFGILFLLTTFAILFSDRSKLAEAVVQQGKAQNQFTPEMLKMMDQPGFWLAVICVGAVLLFVMFTTLASVGGMLAARLFGNGNANPREEQPGSRLG